MRKNVLVQGDLNSIKAGLDKLGHNIVDIQTGSTIDAIVYMTDGTNMQQHSQSMDVGDSVLSDDGAIMINASGKTIEDINNIINDNVYSSLELRGR